MSSMYMTLLYDTYTLSSFNVRFYFFIAGALIGICCCDPRMRVAGSLNFGLTEEDLLHIIDFGTCALGGTQNGNKHDKSSVPPDATKRETNMPD